MIHKFSINNTNVVLDVESGYIHVVDDIVFDLVEDYEIMSNDELIRKYCKKYNTEDLNEAVLEIEYLRENGMLYSIDESEEIELTHKNRGTVVKALCLHVAHDCNLNCRYCFAGAGEYHGPKGLMSEEVGKKALDFLIANSGARRNLEVDFFGGEPLMNFEVVKKLVKYGREQEKISGKNFRFTITTNGVLLNDEIMDFINENMHNVVLSLDGRKEINDLMRPKAGGQGSYDTIVPKFKKLAESRKEQNYYIRGTFTRNNLDFYEDVKHIADLGFTQISVEPVVAEPDKDYAIREEDLPILYEQYEKLAAELYERRKNGNAFNFFHFNIDLEGGPCIVKRLVGCGSGTEYLAVTPEGDLYPCHQFVGNPEFKMGTVYEGVTNLDLREDFLGCNVLTKPECKACWAKYYCSGGCAANAYAFEGSILGKYGVGCDLQKKRIECAIMIKAKEFQEGR